MERKMLLRRGKLYLLVVAMVSIMIGASMAQSVRSQPPLPPFSKRIVKVVLYPTDDAFIIKNKPSKNTGSAKRMKVMNYLPLKPMENPRPSKGYKKRISQSLIKFNMRKLVYLRHVLLESNLKVKILSATLNLYCIKRDGTGRIEIHRLLRNWNEKSVTWKSRPTSYFMPTDSKMIPSKKKVWISFNVTKDILLYLIGGKTLFGWNAKLTDDSNGYVVFRTKEYGEDYAPKLIITLEMTLLPLPHKYQNNKYEISMM